MIFKSKKHNSDLYNTLLLLSRNIFFYKKIGLSDNFKTRIYLMFIHFSLILIIFKSRSTKFDQIMYDSLFNNIENNLREMGLGDVAVNKKMKELNKLFYDILLKVNKNSDKNLNINQKLIFKYFEEFNSIENDKYALFEDYFSKFYNFCFELPSDSMIREAINFNYGST